MYGGVYDNEGDFFSGDTWHPALPKKHAKQSELEKLFLCLHWNTTVRMYRTMERDSSAPGRKLKNGGTHSKSSKLLRPCTLLLTMNASNLQLQSNL